MLHATLRHRSAKEIPIRWLAKESQMGHGIPLYNETGGLHSHRHKDLRKVKEGEFAADGGEQFRFDRLFHLHDVSHAGFAGGFLCHWLSLLPESKLSSVHVGVCGLAGGDEGSESLYVLHHEDVLESVKKTVCRGA